MQHDVVYKHWISDKALEFFFMIDWWSSVMLLKKTSCLSLFSRWERRKILGGVWSKTKKTQGLAGVIVVSFCMLQILRN